MTIGGTSRTLEPVGAQPSGQDVREQGWPKAPGGWGLARVLSDGTLDPIPLFDRAIVGCSGDRAGIVGVSDQGGARGNARFSVRSDAVYVESLDDACVARVEGVPARTLGLAHGNVMRMGEVLAIFVEHELETYRGLHELVGGQLLFGPRQQVWLGRLRSYVNSRDSFVLSGGPSIGKTTLARLLALETFEPALVREIRGATAATEEWGGVQLDQRRAWVVSHIERMPRSAQNELARMVRRSRDGILIATVAGDWDDALTDGVIAPSIASLMTGREVPVPGLDERREDLAAMTLLLSRRIGLSEAAITTDVLEQVLRGGWQGGVDELQNVLWTCLSQQDGGALNRLRGSLSRSAPRFALSLQDEDEDLARQRLRHALEEASGTVATAARELRMSRQSLYRELRRLGLTSPHHAGEADTGAAS